MLYLFCVLKQMIHSVLLLPWQIDGETNYGEKEIKRNTAAQTNKR